MASGGPSAALATPAAAAHRLACGGGGGARPLSSHQRHPLRVPAAAPFPRRLPGPQLAPTSATFPASMAAAASVGTGGPAAARAAHAVRLGPQWLPSGSRPPRGGAATARYFREGAHSEGASEEAHAAAPVGGAFGSDPRDAPTRPRPADSSPSVPSVGGGDAGSPAQVPPQPHAAAFVASTRQHHHPSHQRHAAAVGGGAGGVADNDDVPGGEEELRRRAHALREGLFSEAEQRAVSLHPDILLDEIATAATVPYGAAGSLDGGGAAAAPGDVGAAAGPPSGGAGPHGGLAIESVDPETGGFTSSLPVVDPAYDDVGRAIREQQGHHGHRHHPSLLAAEARARKAATAEDLREALLDVVPELQATYGVFGGGGDLVSRVVRGAAVSDDQVEALLEASSFGQEGAVLADEAEATEEARALVDPLAGPGAGGVTGGGGDPLAALDALAHQEALERLESGTTTAADVADVMPPPFPPGPSSSTAAAARAGGGARVGGAGPRALPDARGTRKGALRHSSGGSGGAAAGGTTCRLRSGRRASSEARPSSSVRHAAPSAGQPPFYRTSPDVPDEDLEGRRRRRSTGLAAGASAAAAAAARAVRGGSCLPSGERQPSGELGRPVDVQAQLYGNSPDVPDEDAERSAAAAAAAAAGVSPKQEGQVQQQLRAATTRVDNAVGPASIAPESDNMRPPEPAGAGRPQRARPPRPGWAQPLPKAARDGRRLESLGDVDRQFIDFEVVGGWDEQANDLRNSMRGVGPKPSRSAQLRLASQAPGARGANGSLQPQTIGIHGNGGGGGGGGSGSGRPGDRPVTVLRVESVPSQTYGSANTAAVLAADGKLTLLARPTGPTPERVRAALKLLRMAPDSGDFRASAAAAAAAAADNDQRAAAATAAAVAAAVAAAGTQGMELEAQQRAASPLTSEDEHNIIQHQPGLILGMTEIDPGDVRADPDFPMGSAWPDHHDPHDPHGSAPMMDGEGHMLGLQANQWQDDYDEVMGQIYDSQRSGWSEDAVNGGFDSDVY